MTSQPQVLLICPDGSARPRLISAATSAHCEVVVASSDEEARLALSASKGPKLALLRLSIPCSEMLGALADWQDVWPGLSLLVVTGQPRGIIPLGVLAYNVMAMVPGPDETDRLTLVLERALKDPLSLREELGCQAECDLLRSLEPALASLERDVLLKGALEQIATLSGAGVVIFCPATEAGAAAATSAPLSISPSGATAADVNAVLELALGADGSPEGIGATSRSVVSDRPARDSLRSLLVLPVCTEQRVWGQLVLVGRHGMNFGPQATRVLASGCRQLAWALHRAQVCHDALQSLAGAEKDSAFRLSVLEQLPCAALVFDLEGHLLAGNAALQTLSGYTRDDLARVSLRGIAPEAAGVLRAAAQQQGALLSPLAIYAKDGRRLLLEAQVSPLRAQERVIGGIALLRDLRQVQRTYEHLVRAEKLRALDELAGGIAHSVNNRLAVILGRAQLAIRRTTDDVLRADLEAIMRSAKDSAELMRRLQASAVMDEGQQQEGQVDVNALVRSVLAAMRRRLREESALQDAPIELVESLAPVPPLFGQEEDLRRVLVGMISNGKAAMPSGGTITVATSQMGNWVAIRISDTGIGMSEQALRRAFDPISASDGCPRVSLALASAYSLVSRHGGDIEVESTAGNGTTFTIRLPSGRSPAAPPSPARQPEPTRQVLVVDDERDICDLVQRILHAEGYVVTVALDGKTAIAQLGRSSYRLVICDLGIADRSGWAIAEAVHEADPTIPVLLITGWELAMTPEELRRRHIRELVRKPFDTQTLVDAVRRSIQAG